MLQISRRADARQREVEAVLILIADGSQCQAAIFDAKPATVPVIGGLDASILQGILNKVIAGVDPGAQPALGRSSIPKQQTEQIVFRYLARQGGGERCIQRLKAGVAHTAENGVSPVVREYIAGVHPARLEVIVRIPFQIAVCAGANFEARNQRRIVVRPVEKCHPSEVERGGQNITPERRGRSPEVRVEEILCRQLPGYPRIGIAATLRVASGEADDAVDGYREIAAAAGFGMQVFE